MNKHSENKHREDKHKYRSLWLLLPAVLVVAYFMIVQPRNSETASVATPDEFSDTAPARVEQPGAEPTGLASETSSLTPDSSSEQEEVARDREFINYAFPLLSTWNLQELKPLLAEETVAASSDEELNEVMSVLEDRLGELKSFDTPQPVTLGEALPEQGPAQDGELQHYQFIAYYEAGEAEIDLILHKRQNASSLYSFNIHVPNQQEIF